MERTVGPALQNIRAGLVQLGVKFTEGIVDWGSTEYSHTLSLTLLQFKPLGLDDDAQVNWKHDPLERLLWFKIGKHK